MKFVWFLISGALCAQVAEKANEGYKSQEARSRVAAVLGSSDRDARQKPKELVAALGLKPGMVVADIGTGIGYLLPYLSQAVGPTGKVMAQDIFPDFLDAARKNASEKRLSNIEFVQGTQKSTNLAADSVDVAIVLDAYHHFDYPAEVLTSLKKALKPNGRLVIVEYHKNEVSMPNGRALEHIRFTADEGVKEVEGFGWKLLERREFIPNVQWMGFFQPK